MARDVDHGWGSFVVFVLIMLGAIIFVYSMMRAMGVTEVKSEVRVKAAVDEVQGEVTKLVQQHDRCLSLLELCVQRCGK